MIHGNEILPFIKKQKLREKIKKKLKGKIPLECMLRMWRVSKSNPQFIHITIYGLKFVLDLEMQHSTLQLELQSNYRDTIQNSRKTVETKYGI